MFRGFRQTGDAVKILSGHDNGMPSSKDSKGNIHMFTGDGFVGNIKYETAWWTLFAGDDPLIPSNWKFRKGFMGKSYGATCLGEDVVIMKSRKGSMWEGTQDCEIWILKADGTEFKQNRTLQQHLDPKGINWFIVNRGHDNLQIVIGCVTADYKQFWAGKTPIQLWVGDPRDINSFQYLTNDIGLHGPRDNFTCTASITQVGDAWVAGLGDIQEGKIYQFRSKDLFGDWIKVGESTYNPPMQRKPWRPHGALIDFKSGPFTLNYFAGTDGQWYEAVTGVGDVTCDNVFIRKVKRI